MSKYAIAFDMDTDVLKQTYHNNSYTNAYLDIENVLSEWGFERKQGSVYFSTEDVDSVTCVLAVQDLSAKHNWFAPSVKDLRMLRIEEINDLRAALVGSNKRKKK